jgi:hypothetical protein
MLSWSSVNSSTAGAARAGGGALGDMEQLSVLEQLLGLKQLVELAHQGKHS